MFRATLCPSSGPDDFEVFIRCVAEQILDKYENNTTHYYSSATHLINTSKSSPPEDGNKVARNMLSNLQRRNKHNTKSDI